MYFEGINWRPKNEWIKVCHLELLLAGYLLREMANPSIKPTEKESAILLIVKCQCINLSNTGSFLPPKERFLLFPESNIIQNVCSEEERGERYMYIYHLRHIIFYIVPVK